MPGNCSKHIFLFLWADIGVVLFEQGDLFLGMTDVEVFDLSDLLFEVSEGPLFRLNVDGFKPIA